MKKTNFAHMATAVVAIALPMAAWAQTNNATISAGGNFSFDSGTNVSSGGDISFTGTSIAFVGNAKGIVLTGFTGITLFGDVPVSLLEVAALQEFSSSPIQASSLTAGTASGTIIGLETNAGNYAKFLITALSSSSISFQYTTYGTTGTGGSGPSGPTITAVLNNSSLIPAGFSNSGIAPSSLFQIQGSGMATPGTTPILQDSTKGLPTTLNGASISVTVGGTTVTPAIYYSSPTQIAAVLPAGTPVGSGTITVSYSGTPSSSTPIQVVPSAYGFDIYDGAAVATDATSGALITYTNSAKPGEVLVFWGTGLGSDPADSDNTYTSTPHLISTPVQMYIGGVPVPSSAIAYSGASVYPGVDVIGVTIPQGVSNGCYVSVVLVTGSGSNAVASNFVTLPIMDSGGICTEPLYGITGSQIGGTTTTVNQTSGSVLIGQLVESGTTTNLAEASFESISGTVIASGGSGGVVSIGGCVVSELVSGSTGTGGSITETPLDAGTLSVQGPGGTYPLPLYSKGIYDAQLPAGAIPQSGGTFVFTGTGGADVGPFTATVNLPNPILTWTNQSAAATVTRANGLTVTWTGGGPGTYVYISGSSAGNGVAGGFSCYAPQSALQFTVPSYVLSVLPAGQGSVLLENLPSYTTFSAQGLQYGYGIGFTGVSVTGTFQ